MDCLGSLIVPHLIQHLLTTIALSQQHMPFHGSSSFLLHSKIPSHLNQLKLRKPLETSQLIPFMACATTRPTFSFHLSQVAPPKARTHLRKLPFVSICKPQKAHFTVQSIDFSKEDKTPTSNQTNTSATESSTGAAEAEGSERKFDKRRLEEKFAVLNTGIYECRSCGYKYDETVGDPSYPIPPGFQFDKLPEDWRCPTCGAAKSFFESKRVEIAGFAQNQQYGLGGNTLTSDQKALLIYGTLLFFFALFLLGYFLQ
ncbi:hypothetical protein K2173_017661 [Erythroxylum novogranatense]|uniref:Rubredoxin-like domain-containing protein n=1 Tax=Erythroxylum novogranatense TaxID=1862640 RepID=A0AAV8T2Y1_9ROSI|nr:hypothetical protein K2173_017661 [Erythroxylum novogranatense]